MIGSLVEVEMPNGLECDSIMPATFLENTGYETGPMSQIVQHSLGRFDDLHALSTSRVATMADYWLEIR